MTRDLTPLFEPESPPLAPEVVAEIERVRTEKEEALEQQEFERAAALRDQERRLLVASRQLTRAWKREPEPAPSYPRGMPGVSAQMPGSYRRTHLRRHRRPWVLPLLLGWLLAVATGGVSLFVGWLIWG